MLRKSFFVGLFSWVLGAAVVLAADQPGAAELKLRESLRAALLKLRAAEAERANLQIANAELTQSKQAVEEQLAALTKKSAAEQTAAAQAAAALQAKVEERDREIGELRVSLEKWKRAHGEVSAVARAREEAGAQLAAKLTLSERRVAAQQLKNAALFKLGNEILTRYERFGLGDALTAREPFVGLTRVKFQNLVEEYGDKLSEQKIAP